MLGCATLVACSDSGSAAGTPGGGAGGGPRAQGSGQLPGYEGPSLPTTPGPLAAAELGDAFERILCHALVECEGASYPDADACVADREPSGLQDVLDGIADGSLSYDADAMGDCRRLFEANLCALSGSFLFVPSAPDVVERCRATHGMRSEGESCRNGLECRGDAFCDLESSCPGVCRAKVAVGGPCTEAAQCAPLTPLPDDLTLAYILEHAEELQREYEPSRVRCEDTVCRASSVPGDPCPMSDVIVVGGMGCVGELTYCDTASAQCVARRDEGEPCAYDEQCEEPLWCDRTPGGPTDDAPGTCRVRSAQGGPCESVSNCASGLRCLEPDAQGRGHCAPRSTDGGPCAFAIDCDRDLGCVEGLCTPLPIAGAACTDDSRCASGLACAGETVCAEVVLPGEPCDEATRTCLGICRAGTCDARAALGAACTDGADCASRVCTDGACIDDDLCVNAEP